MNRPLQGLHAAVLARSVDGVSCHDIDGYTKRQVGSACDKLRNRGHLFVGKTSHLNARYFDTPAKADAYTAALKAMPPKRSHKKQPPNAIKVKPSKPVKVKSYALGWAPNDPMHITPRTKVTVCPSMPQPSKTNTYPQFI